MRAIEFIIESIQLGNNDAARAWIDRVYTKYPHTMQNNHVMVWGSGDDQQFAMFELIPSFSKRGAVEVKWFQAYPLRQGVGSRAMKELQAMAREDGIALTLFPWDKGQVSQAKLTKFYRGQGFKPAVKGAKNMQWDPSIDEAFDTPLPITWEKGDHGDVDALAKLPDGSNLSIMFNKQDNVKPDDKTWMVEFYRNNSQEVTGEGDAQKVFSTVLVAIQQFITKYKPLKIYFSASKEVEPGQNTESRSKLYDRLVLRYANSLGYKFFRADNGSSVMYQLSRIPKPKAVSGAQYLIKNVDEAEVATKNSNEIWRQLKAAGYHYVGSGADATVFAKDDSHVIKILMPEDAGSKAEQVFRKFYEFSISHQNLLCVPRFNEVNTIDINGKDYTQIEMEKLSSIDKNSFAEGLVWYLSDFTSANTPWAAVDSKLAQADTWYMYSPNYSGTFARTWQSLQENPASKKTYAMYKQLYTVMQLLYRTGNINRFGWDLHTANVMQRGNGQPVIIDPWFSEGTS